MLPGSFLIIVSVLPEYVAEDFGYQHRKLGNLTLRLHTAEKCSINIFQCSPPPYVPGALSGFQEHASVTRHSAPSLDEIDVGDDTSSLATLETDLNISSAGRSPKQAFSPLYKRGSHDSTKSATSSSGISRKQIPPRK
jgi:hypothetical protein